MAVVNCIEWGVLGDIGGQGVTRWWFENAAHTTASNADCNSAAAASHAFYNSLNAQIPTAVTWTCVAGVGSFDVATALPAGLSEVTSLPGAVVGTNGYDYPAGVGARVNATTNQIVNRRYLRGGLFLVPLGGSNYSGTTGAINASDALAIATAYSTYLAAMATASLSAVIWHRPKPIAAGNGVAYSIVSANVPLQPASLRSRRS